MNSQMWMLLAFLAPLSTNPAQDNAVFAAKGYLMPARQVLVSANNAGQVMECMIEEGQKVKSGSILAKLNSRQQELALELAKAELALAMAQLDKARGVNSIPEVRFAEAGIQIAKVKMALAQERLDNTVLRAHQWDHSRQTRPGGHDPQSQWQPRGGLVR